MRMKTKTLKSHIDPLKKRDCNQLNNPHLILLNPAAQIHVSNAHFLQTTDMLQLYFSLGSVFNFML